MAGAKHQQTCTELGKALVPLSGSGVWDWKEGLDPLLVSQGEISEQQLKEQ